MLLSTVDLLLFCVRVIIFGRSDEGPWVCAGTKETGGPGGDGAAGDLIEATGLAPRGAARGFVIGLLF